MFLAANMQVITYTDWGCISKVEEEEVEEEMERKRG